MTIVCEFIPEIKESKYVNWCVKEYEKETDRNFTIDADKLYEILTLFGIGVDAGENLFESVKISGGENIDDIVKFSEFVNFKVVEKSLDLVNWFDFVNLSDCENSKETENWFELVKNSDFVKE